MPPRFRTLQPRFATLDTSIARPPPKVADAELLTSEHRAWRDAVIRRANGLCQGADHRGDRSGHRLVADHIIERRDRPDLALDPRNGQALCWSCHTRKTNVERARRTTR